MEAKPTFRSGGRFLAKKRDAVESFAAFAQGGDFPKYPLEVYLEVSNVCDLRCVMCPRFSAFNPGRKKAIWDTDPGFLEMDRAARALEPLLEHALVVHAFGYGEPTIHPDFPEFLAHIASYEVLVDFFTNGMHLTEALVSQLVELAIFQITVSFSGATAAAYESVYQGGDFERVLAGLARLRGAKSAAGSPYPRVHVNSLSFDHHVRELDRFVQGMADHGVENVGVMRLLEHEATLPQLAGHAADFRSPEIREAVERARRAASDRGIVLSLHPVLEAELSAGARPEERLPVRRAPAVALESFVEVARSLPVLPRPEAPDPRIEVIDLERDRPGEVVRRLEVGIPPREPGDLPFYCLEPFKTFYLRRGGQVKTCCYMSDEAPAFGDVRKASGERIWNGSAYAAARGSIVNGLYPLSVCRSCLENRQAPDSHGVDRMIRSYAAWAGTSPGSPFDEATAEALAASPGTTIVDRLFRTRRDGLALAGASRRMRRLVELLDEDSSWLSATEGWVDHVSERGVAGWIWSPPFPDLRLPVSIWIGERKVADLCAAEFRPDLFDLGKGDGRYGFSYPAPLSPGEVEAALVRIGDSKMAIERIRSLR